MKIRHLLLYALACTILIIADFSGASLLAFFAWLQVYMLLSQQTFNKSSQLWALKLFLISIPLLLFWGSIHSFLFIYLTETNYLFLIMTMLLDLSLCLAATVYFIFSFEAAGIVAYRLLPSLQKSWEIAKAKKLKFFQLSGSLFTITLIPWIGTDWKIIFAITAIHLFLSRNQLRQVFDSGF